MSVLSTKDTYLKNHPVGPTHLFNFIILLYIILQKIVPKRIQHVDPNILDLLLFTLLLWFILPPHPPTHDLWNLLD